MAGREGDPRRRRAHQPRRPGIRRRRRDEARPRRLPRRGGRPDHPRARASGRCRWCACGRGQAPFMQKNLPEVRAGLDRAHVGLGARLAARGRLRAVRRPAHAAVVRQPAGRRVPPELLRVDEHHAEHLVLDLDPPPGADFTAAVAAARLVRAALAEVGLAAAVKTSGAKGLHVFVPLAGEAALDDAAAATRAVAARAARARPGRRHHGVHQGGPRRARCSSTRRGRGAPPSSRATARGPGPARRCRSRSGGTTSTR